jgi:hypothetical protein
MHVIGLFAVTQIVKRACTRSLSLSLSFFLSLQLTEFGIWAIGHIRLRSLLLA